MSVSGYILAAPGRGRIYRVVPSSLAVRVSAGMPVHASCARSTTAFSASNIFSAVSATKTTASPSAASTALRKRFNFFRCDSIVCSISSVWNIPPTLPQNLARSDNSLPKRKLGINSRPVNPAKPVSLTAKTFWFLSTALRMTLLLVSLKMSVTSTNSGFKASRCYASFGEFFFDCN